MSIITTLFWGAVSLTHMYFSDSIVTCVKFMNCGLIPRLGNVRASFMIIGALAAAMVA
uniref:Clathrin heavy chain 2-like n=1 Tax=Rhizophora mucronata TaxID=61149 RepID=A0A2P2MB53_RHIMU